MWWVVLSPNGVSIVTVVCSIIIIKSHIDWFESRKLSLIFARKLYFVLINSYFLKQIITIDRNISVLRFHFAPYSLNMIVENIYGHVISWRLHKPHLLPIFFDIACICCVTWLAYNHDSSAVAVTEKKSVRAIFRRASSKNVNERLRRKTKYLQC